MLRARFELMPVEGQTLAFYLDMARMGSNWLLATDLRPPLVRHSHASLICCESNEVGPALVARGLDALWPQVEGPDEFDVAWLRHVRAVLLRISFFDGMALAPEQLHAWSLDCMTRPARLRSVWPGTPGQSTALELRSAPSWQRFLVAVQCWLAWCAFAPPQQESLQ